MSVLKIIIGIALLLACPVVGVVLWAGYGLGHGLLLSGLGYDVDIDPKELAEIIYAENGSVNRCKNLTRSVPVMGPTLDDQRMRCVFEYASLAKDPSACELLMPSSYGWDCLGAAEKPNARECWFDFGPTPPQVGHGNDVVTLPECASNPKLMQQNRCCELAETLYVDKKNNCDALKEPTMLHDQCLELMAKRDKKLDLCHAIQDQNIRSGCEVAVRALQKE